MAQQPVASKAIVEGMAFYLAGGADRIAAVTTVSSATRKRERSDLAKEDGPPVATPSSRRWRPISRPASALPILSVVQCFPLWAMALAPFARQREASGISPVTQISAEVSCSG